VNRFFLTITTNSPHSKAVMGRLKSKVVCHLVLQRLDLCRIELDHLTAISADHVVMVFVIKMMLVICFIVAESHLAGETGFG